MDLLSEIKKVKDKDTRPITEQIAYLKKLGAFMLLNNNLYKDHVISFCATLVKIYETLNKDDSDTDKLLHCDELNKL